MEGGTWEERFWTLEYLVWDGRRGGGDDVRFRNRGWARGGVVYADEDVGDVGDVGVWWREGRGCGWKGGEVEGTALWKWGWILGTVR
jgi:hypothetical protein